jgi:ParB family chromosome partitioning protein
MLAENMQRADLTLPEEVGGIQMMLDLGETVASVADITGLSETTVRRRAKLAEYGKGALAEAVQRGATIEDYVKLDAVKDHAAREALLKDIGTNSFDWKLSSEIVKQNTKENLLVMLDEINQKGYIKIKTVAEWHSGKYELLHSFFRFIKPDGWEWPSATTKKYYYFIDNESLRLFIDASASDQKTSAKEKKLQAELQTRLDALKDVCERAREQRKAWVKAYTPKKADMPKILRMLCLAMSNGASARRASIVKLIEIAFIGTRYYLGLEDAEIAAAEIGWEKLSFLQAYVVFEDDYSAALYSVKTGEYNKNTELPVLYAYLSALGYPVSEEEKALCDGTHELYAKPETTE